MSEYVSGPLPSANVVAVADEVVVADEVAVADVADEEPEPEPEPVQVVSTSENADTSNQKELEERVKVLEERLDKLIELLKGTSKHVEYDDGVYSWCGPLVEMRESFNQ